SVVTGATPSHEFMNPGTYTATLTVTDNDLATGTATIPITVSEPEPNQPPTAVASVTKQFDPGTGGTAYTLFSNTSTDNDGTIVNVTWRLGSETGTIISSAPSPASFRYVATDGAYTFYLIVTDDDGASDTTFISVTENQAPVIN